MQHRLIIPAFLGSLLIIAPLGSDESRDSLAPKDTLPAEWAIDLIPVGLDGDRRTPKDNPITDARVKLGRKLFFDPILSSNHKVSCAGCHLPEHGFAGPQVLPVGASGKPLIRNAPSLLNRTYGSSFFWDGRSTTLEEQALKPIEEPDELGAGIEEALRRLRADDMYRAAFEQAYSDGLTAQNLGRAIAAFERTLLIGDSPVDFFRKGEIAHLKEQELHGLWLFESKGRCWQCHSGQNFTDENFHNSGVSWGKMPIDLGRYSITKQDGDQGKFKTPTLRASALTAPYMHDGSLATLEDVIAFYNKGGEKNPHLSPMMQPLDLTKDEELSLVAFLKALSREVEAE